MKILLLLILLTGVAGASDLVNRAKRTQLLEQADLVKETSSWDELDKDLLIMQAGKQSAAESESSLQKQYPRLPANKLQKLQSLRKQ